MRFVYLLLLIAALSCRNHSQKTMPPSPAHAVNRESATKQVDNSKYYISQDTLILPLETGDTAKYSKEEFNDIVNAHPELFDEEVLDPDATYATADKKNFDSEVGQDNYYVLYAYFLKQRNGVDKNAAQRKRLIDIYQNINQLFGNLQHGGTYFGHQT